MTCTPIGIYDHRILIYGKRIPLKVAQAKKTISRDSFSQMNLWRDAIILLLALVLLWWLHYWYKARQRRNKLTNKTED